MNIAGSLALRNGSSIVTRASGTGNAADLHIIAKDISIVGINTATDPGEDFTGFSAATNTGRGGNLRITADNLRVTDKGQITTATTGSGPGGTLTIQLKGDLHLTNGGQISALTGSSGKAGDIEIVADNLILSGVSKVPVKVDNIDTVSAAAISTQTQLGVGNAGNIRITARSVQVLDGAQIDAETFGKGDGGSIQVNADRVVISGVSAVTRELLPDCPLCARSGISTEAESRFTTDAITGKGGNIHIQAREIHVIDGGRVASGTTGTGAGGDVTFMADRITLANDGRVESRSTVAPNAGKAGNITITARAEGWRRSRVFEILRCIGLDWRNQGRYSYLPRVFPTRKDSP